MVFNDCLIWLLNFLNIFFTNFLVIFRSACSSLVFFSRMRTSIHSRYSNLIIVLGILIPRSVPHDDVIKWKHFPRYWPFVRGIHRSLVNSPHKGQWREPLMFSLICTRINGWVNNGEAGDLRRHRAHYDVTIMCISLLILHFIADKKMQLISIDMTFRESYIKHIKS